MNSSRLTCWPEPVPLKTPGVTFLPSRTGRSEIAGVAQSLWKSDRDNRDIRPAKKNV
jgi:hypothetical protein